MTIMLDLLLKYYFNHHLSYLHSMLKRENPFFHHPKYFHESINMFIHECKIHMRVLVRNSFLFDN